MVRHRLWYRTARPRGRLQSLWCGRLFNSDTLAAINQAVADGVDVVNYSISGGTDPYGDVVSLAFLDAYDAGALFVPVGRQLRAGGGHSRPPRTVDDHRGGQHQ